MCIVTNGKRYAKWGKFVRICVTQCTLGMKRIAKRSRMERGQNVIFNQKTFSIYLHVKFDKIGPYGGPRQGKNLEFFTVARFVNLRPPRPLKKKKKKRSGRTLPGCSI